MFLFIFYLFLFFRVFALSWMMMIGKVRVVSNRPRDRAWPPVVVCLRSYCHGHEDRSRRSLLGVSDLGAEHPAPDSARPGRLPFPSDNSRKRKRKISGKKKYGMLVTRTTQQYGTRSQNTSLVLSTQRMMKKLDRYRWLPLMCHCKA